LLRHCKEVHVTKQQYKPLAFNNRTKNYIQSKTRPRPGPSTPIHQHHQIQMPQQIMHIEAPIPVQTSINCHTPPHILSRYDQNSPSPSATMPALSPFWTSPIKSGVGIQAKPIEPLFVNPPKPARLAHSATYIKYIEGLQTEKTHLSNWEKELNASPENTAMPNRNRLPVQWLANGSGNHGNVVNALWALRNFMLQDSLTIYKSSNQQQ